MLRYLKAFYEFWYDFIIGDDWTVAAGVVILLGLVALFPASHPVAWLAVPVIIVLLLALSVWRLAAPHLREE